MRSLFERSWRQCTEEWYRLNKIGTSLDQFIRINYGLSHWPSMDSIQKDNFCDKTFLFFNVTNSDGKKSQTSDTRNQVESKLNVKCKTSFYIYSLSTSNTFILESLKICYYFYNVTTAIINSILIMFSINP